MIRDVERDWRLEMRASLDDFDCAVSELYLTEFYLSVTTSA